MQTMNGITNNKAIKKAIAVLITIAALFVVLCGCGKKQEDTSYIGIISAMDNEIAILLKEASVERVDEIADVEYYIGTLRGQAGFRNDRSRYCRKEVLFPDWSGRSDAFRHS